MNFQRLMGTFQKLFAQGPVWFLSRTKKELKSPSIRFMKQLMTEIKSAKRQVSTPFVRDDRLDEDFVTAIWDLNEDPTTYDFAFFLVAAELFAKKNGKNSFVVHFIRSNDQVEIGPPLALLDKSEFQWRFDNIILPLISFCPACIGYSRLPKALSFQDDFKGKLIYPDFYDGNYTPHPDYYREVHGAEYEFIGLKAPVKGVKYIESWKKANNLADKVVTITLRQYGYDPARNNNVDEWVKFAKTISKEGFTPVFIPDTHACFDDDSRFGDFIVFKEPCWNIGLRMALYTESLVNFFVQNGPANLAHLSKDITSICMKWIVPDSLQGTHGNHIEKGVKIGQRKYNFVEGYQVLSWKDDTCENICEEFYEFLADHSQSLPDLKKKHSN